MRYTEAVRDHNTAIKKFPTMIYAGWFTWIQGETAV